MSDWRTACPCRLRLPRCWLFSLVLGCGLAGAQALRLPAQPAVAFSPATGAQLPLDAVLRDERGAAIRLGAAFDRSPVVLVPGYYTCRNLCSTLFDGVAQALALSGMRAGDYRLVGISIDPRDTAPAAAARRAACASVLPGGAADVRMLTGEAPALGAIAMALGYRAIRDATTGELAHAAGFVVADADGRVARYFSGVRFDPAGLRAALLAARERRAGPVPLGERLLLLCAHYDPALGRYTGAALATVRAGALAATLGLGVWLWRRRRGAGQPARLTPRFAMAPGVWRRRTARLQSPRRNGARRDAGAWQEEPP